MESRSREGRRGGSSNSSSILASNGFNRRRHRTTNTLRDSPDEDGGVEFHESVRLRERVKKDRDRDRERDLRERDLRERSNRSKRRRGDETSEESMNDDEDDEDDVRLPVASISHNHHHHHHQHHTSFSQQQQNNSNTTSSNIASSCNINHLNRKTFPPKVLRAPPVWKSGDEMIGVSVPRKARSASTKRSHDWISSSSNNNSGGGVSGGDQNPAQPSTSPVIHSHVSTPPAPTSPSSPNASVRKKLKQSINNNTTGQKLKPPKVSSTSSSGKPSSSNPEELEIEIAEVLYGLMTQSQPPPSTSSSSKKEDSREINNRLNTDVKPLNLDPTLGPNSNPISAVALKRKRARQAPENSSFGARCEKSSSNMEKNSAENGCEMRGNNVNSHGQPAEPESTKLDSDLKPVAESRDLVPIKEDVSLLSKERESPAVRAQDSNNRDSPSIATSSLVKPNLLMCEMENQKEEKFEIDLMAPPPQARSVHEVETKIDLRASAVDQKPVLSVVDSDIMMPAVSKAIEDDKGKNGSGKDHSSNLAADEKKKCKASSEGAKSNTAIENKCRSIDLHLDLEKPGRDNGSKSQTPLTEKSGHSTSSLPLPMSMANWPGGLPPMGYMAPLQGVMSMDGGSVTPPHILPLFSQLRPKRCATHCHIAKSIICFQQFMKMNPFWPAPAGSAPLFGSKPCNVGNAQDKGQSLAGNLDHGGKEKGSQSVNSSDSAQRKQQTLIQQALPPVAPSNLLGPTFIFPLNQQQAAVAARSGTAKTPTTGPSSNASSSATTVSSSAPTAMSFSYPNMAAANETQYLAILQNNAYPFPIPPNYRGPPPQAMPLFNGSFYPSQIIHQQFQQPPPSNQSPPFQQAHHTASASNSSSSSQKHLQNNLSSQKSQPLDSPSTTDNRGSRVPVNIYGQNFAMPIHPQNFALMTQNSNQMEKKSNPPQQQGLKTGVNSLPPHSFAMSFGPINGGPAAPGPGIDTTSMAQSQSMFQNSQETARQSIQMMAAAAVAAQVAQKKNFRISEEGKSGNIDTSAKEEERKSFAFTRSDLNDAPANSVTIAPGPARSSRPATTNGMGMMNVSNAHVQAQLQQQQMLQLKQQQQQMAAANAVNNRSKGTATSNGNIYSEHLNSSSMKFPNAISPFPQNLVQSNSTGPAQSPQWKSSSRMTATSQAPSSLGPSTTQTHKNLPQQHSRTQTQPPMHAQISFTNQKSSAASSQGPAPPISNQAPSSPMRVGSPTTSKGTSASPRTTSSAPTNNKTVQAPSMLGNPHIAASSSSGSGAKTPFQQQSQPKIMQQAQLFFSNPYSQSQSQSTASSTNVGLSGYYMQQRRRADQHQQAPGGASSSMNTNDPAIAIAAATCNVKGGGLTSFGGHSTGTLLPAGFSYVHPVQAAVQVKPAEQKQPAGNDNLHKWQPEKK